MQVQLIFMKCYKQCYLKASSSPNACCVKSVVVTAYFVQCLHYSLENNSIGDEGCIALSTALLESKELQALMYEVNHSYFISGNIIYLCSSIITSLMYSQCGVLKILCTIFMQVH